METKLKNSWIARFRCWWKGHYIIQEQYVVEDAKKYHGHVEIRTFGKCKYCGKGTKENALWYRDEYSLLERHRWIAPTLFLISVLLILAFFLGGLPWLVSMKECHDSGIQMGLESKYSFWSGCYYKVEERWLADELLKVVDIIK